MNLLDCHSQSYNNSTNMANKCKSVESRLHEMNEKNLFVLCNAHTLHFVSSESAQSSVLSVTGLMTQTILNDKLHGFPFKVIPFESNALSYHASMHCWKDSSGMLLSSFIMALLMASIPLKCPPLVIPLSSRKREESHGAKSGE